MTALRRLLVTLCILVALGAAVWWGWSEWERRADVQSTDDAYVRGEITVLAPRVPGYVVAILADDGQPVDAKQPVVRIDPRDYRAAARRALSTVQAALAALSQAQARLELQNNQIAVAQAARDSAEAQARNADIVLSRARELLGRGAGTQAALNNATAADVAAQSLLSQATSQLDLQQRQVAVLQADVNLATAKVADTQAALNTARLALEDTEVWSPIAGAIAIANRRTRVGEYVTAGTRMLSIVPKDGLWIEANFRETQLARMQPDQPVAIFLDTYAGQRLCGYVEAIGAAAGSEFALVPPDNATDNFTKIVRRFPVRIRPSAMDPGLGLLKPGMSSEVRVAVEGAEVDGCRFDPTRDRQPPSIPKLPAHQGLDENGLFERDTLPDRSGEPPAP